MAINKLYPIIFFFLLLSSFSFAIDSTQTFNKILLNPFYRVSMSQNTNYTYLMALNPPDKVSFVNSALLGLQVYLTPSVTFYAWVNGTSCNTASYTVSTTYASAGQGTITFDCANVINKAGFYQITIRPTSANTGASTAWVDLTYTNNASDYVGTVGNVSTVDSVKGVGKGTMHVFGTEYYENDDGTLFLQLKDSLGNPIQNATCDVDIFYPYTTHPFWVNDAMMLNRNYEGIYYYDFITPSISGLYMAVAKCYYYTSHQLYYDETSSDFPIRNTITGTYTGNSFVLNTFTDWLYTQCDSATSGGNKACDASYNFTVGTNISQMYVNYMGESSGSPTMTFSYYNWSSGNWVALPNTLLFHATATSSVPSGVDEYQSNQIPFLNYAVNSHNGVSIRTTATAGSTFKLFSNWLTLDTSKGITTAQELKGSGEIHVSSVIPDSISGRFYKILTCEGNIDGRCGIFTNDGEFDLVEGEIEDFINVSATSTRESMDIKYSSPFTVDCSALYWIKKYNGTNWTDFTNYETYSVPAEENCLITIDADLVSGEEYQYWLKFDNYMKWEVEYTKQISESVLPTIDNACLGRNWNYTTPITESTPLSSDPVIDFCHRAYDDYYWMNTYYNDSLATDIVGEYASYLQELRFYRKELYNRYNFLVLNNDTKLISEFVWKGEHRNLTYYPTANLTITASINTTQVSESVWGWEGNVSDSLLTKIATKIWEYLGSVAEIIS